MVTVHLSDDIGSTTTQHYEAVAAELLRLTKIALDNRKKVKKTMQKYNVDPDLSQFEAMSTRFHWVKIVQASKEVGAVIPYQNGKRTKERFYELMDLWIHHRTGEAQTAPNTSGLKNALTAIIDGSTKNIADNEATKLTHFKELRKHCVAIEMSELFVVTMSSVDDKTYDSEWLNTLTKNDMFFVEILRQRLRAVCVYSSGAEKYLTFGVDRFRKIFSHTETRIESLLKFEWIGNKDTSVHIVPKSIQWPESSTTFISGNVTANNESALSMDAIVQIFSELWKKGEGFTGRVHCEVAMAYYIIRNNIKIENLAIGSAKVICASCHELLTAIPTHSWRLSSYSTKVFGDWLLPDIPMETHTKEMMAICFRAVCDLAGDFCDIIARTQLRGWTEDDCIC